uniref:Gamma-glutamylcyclotransferase family protein n=1 Tax=Rhabditophanes sp. KR3021 TaxID=114890 RepID=A0AC35TLM9_9BILA
MLSQHESLRYNIFVYGTLKRNEPNNHMLLDAANGNSLFRGSALTDDKFLMVIGSKYNIPFCLDIQEKGSSQIIGEVYEIDENMLDSLDVFEGFPKFYDRKEITVNTSDNRTINAWIYLLSDWSDTFLQSCSTPINNYFSLGSHGRRYVKSETCTTIEEFMAFVHHKERTKDTILTKNEE